MMNIDVDAVHQVSLFTNFCILSRLFIYHINVLVRPFVTLKALRYVESNTGQQLELFWAFCFENRICLRQFIVFLKSKKSVVLNYEFHTCRWTGNSSIDRQSQNFRISYSSELSSTLLDADVVV